LTGLDRALKKSLSDQALKALDRDFSDQGFNKLPLRFPGFGFKPETKVTSGNDLRFLSIQDLAIVCQPLSFHPKAGLLTIIKLVIKI
jgi:hypothetical protein